MSLSCEYCGVTLNPQDKQVWHQVAGWERKAFGDSRKSGSDIVLREKTGLLACPTCMAALRTGVSPQQSSLLT